MFEISKSAKTQVGAVDETELTLINAHALQPLDAESVFVFSVNACNDQVDRDYERFPLESLHAMAPLFIGKTVIRDHDWSTKNQVARVYDSTVIETGGANVLRLKCYMLDNAETKPTIDAIKGGILREVSVGCQMGGSRCSICNRDAWDKDCEHWKGRKYNGETCHFDLVDPKDAYEVSFVAVPAQPGAGVAKSENHKSAWTPGDIARAKAMVRIERERMNTYEC